MKTRCSFLVMTMLAAIAVTLVGCGQNASENTPAPEKAAPAAPPATPPPAPPAAGPAMTNNAAATTNVP